MRRALAAATRRRGHVLNFCADRYCFAVGLAASLVSGKRSILPSTHTPEVIRHLRAFAPDVFCLTDDPQCPLELPQLLCVESSVAANGSWPAPGRFLVPQIDAGQLAAYVFTSGSSGTPVPHAKTWGRLVQCVRAEVTRLAPINPAGARSSARCRRSICTALNPPCCCRCRAARVVRRTPVLPGRYCRGAARPAAPRVLISTPVHLRALLTAEQALPPLELIVSATAMLPANLAREVESRYGAKLLEIYGSTETGQMASRRTALEAQWWLWPGVRLTVSDGQCSAHGGHVERPIAVADVLEPCGDEHFVLHGRTADLVNIAGKRSSLAYLNHQLNAIPGVVDGAFFVRDDTQASLAGVTRLAALVVAPKARLRPHHPGAARAHRRGIPAAAAAAGGALAAQCHRQIAAAHAAALTAQAAVQQPHLFA
jgi:acyl-coenzyme A synthetase/AMP-(fatty) acid ligase